MRKYRRRVKGTKKEIEEEENMFNKIRP